MRNESNSRLKWNTRRLTVPDARLKVPDARLKVPDARLKNRLNWTNSKRECVKTKTVSLTTRPSQLEEGMPSFRSQEDSKAVKHVIFFPLFIFMEQTERRLLPATPTCLHILVHCFSCKYRARPLV
ncbi:hypothetical protein SERLA73DRAFT_166804 [Serpula lacrymans var. lacrymans S7.3]|uniref:Uncharacterized protein n=2 Tax=Serpula lacrymans var. lacrymans TaxID=341189 RepID=F8PR71_SERL3|nr:uncharacterized protein SERLADRAFT_414242 [Serpula lacrymans var. lacrymans S7.9]EGO02362.1 hypothetical protein SERLA73DRAFT_166804 [Serpula lacrymans var. lacrymans S7.3]EGO28091.1 hypothetical protein SERLADRAFT_414242 [Serpula lacrymans var. lacrymans S7.9]